MANVALLAEGVGRNTFGITQTRTLPLVALLAEGVGRNTQHNVFRFIEKVSPSSRRAWVEIQYQLIKVIRRKVALLAEGVGRNTL